LYILVIMPHRAVTTEGSVLINNMAATRAAKEESYIAEERLQSSAH